MEEKETRFEGCELKKEREMMRGEIYIYTYTLSIPERSSCSKKQDRLKPLTSSNVTQAAAHKERWREQITQKKKKNTFILPV